MKTKINDYFSPIGELTIRFATIEYLLFELLKTLLNSNEDEIMEIIVKDYSIEKIRLFCKKIISYYEGKINQDLLSKQNQLLIQIKEIQTLRNDLIHGLLIEEFEENEKGLIYTGVIIKNKKKQSNLNVSIQQIENANDILANSVKKQFLLNECFKTELADYHMLKKQSSFPNKYQ